MRHCTDIGSHDIIIKLYLQSPRYVRGALKREMGLMAKYFAEIQEIYEDYVDKTIQLDRSRKLGEGIFGMAGPKTDPCHGVFADIVKTKLDAAAREGISSAETREILEYIFKMPVEQQGNQLAYWMLLAVHGAALNLAERLDASDAEPLLALYLRLYPKYQWLPVQKQLVSILKARRRE